MQGFDLKPDRKRTLGRPRRRWENNFKIYLKEILLGGRGVERSGSRRGQLTAVVYTAMNM